MNSKGFSLIELMIAVGIGLILILIVAGIAVIGFSQMNSLRDRLAAEENLNRVEILLRSTVGQAVDIRSVDVVYGANFPVSTWAGGLRAPFLWNTIASTPANWNTIGHFYREMGGTMTTGVQGNGDLFPTAIFYRRPTATTSGVLFFHMGMGTPPPTPPPKATTLTPSYSEPYVDRISFLQMDKNLNDAYGRVSSLRFRVAVRYHDFSSIARVWCPVADIQAATAGCVTAAKYRDLEKEFTILVRNNLLKPAGTAGMTGTLAEERVMGFLYFFKLISPLGI